MNHIYVNPKTAITIQFSANDILQELTLLETNTDSISEYINMTYSPFYGAYQFIIDNYLPDNQVILFDKTYTPMIEFIK